MLVLPVYLAAAFKWLLIWMASSRVGVNIRAYNGLPVLVTTGAGISMLSITFTQPIPEKYIKHVNYINKLLTNIESYEVQTPPGKVTPPIPLCTG